jgi:hypothetical protein
VSFTAILPAAGMRGQSSYYRPPLKRKAALNPRGGIFEAATLRNDLT